MIGLLMFLASTQDEVSADSMEAQRRLRLRCAFAFPLENA